MMPLARPIGNFVYLVYLEDSGDSRRYQVIGAVIIRDVCFGQVERCMAELIDRAALSDTSIPKENARSSFEFHADPMFHQKPPFEKLSRDTAIELFDGCISIINSLSIPIVYGAVDLKRANAGLYPTANPIDVAFRLCAPGIEKWLQENAPSELGLIISDETRNQHIKNAMQNAFRSLRRQVRAQSHTRGRLEHMHDDMYFGDSAHSVGIQLADVCSFIIRRHLCEDEEVKYLYEKLKERIYYRRIAPRTVKPKRNIRAANLKIVVRHKKPTLDRSKEIVS